MRLSAKNIELAAATERDPRWASVIARSSEADGTFFYSVRTTGVYCRPSCAARVARPENVRFHPTRQDAEQAGFRPCRRCKPDQPSLIDQHAAMVTEACRLIEASQSVPTLEELANHAGVSGFHLHRVFKAITGVTPREYAAAHRGERVRKELGRSGSVTAAIYQSGYNSNGRFYGESQQVLGMTPTIYRAGVPTPISALPSASAPSGPFSWPGASSESVPFSWAMIPTPWLAPSRTGSLERR